MLKKLKHNKGVFMSLVTYPILILAVGYSAIAFVAAINGNNLTKITFRNTQAGYNAYKGIEYTALEIINQGITPFVTHIADSNNILQANTDIGLLQPRFGGAITVSNTYHLNLGAAGSVDAKIYLKDNQLFILARGNSGGKERLFLHKVSGTSLYDYFFFFPRIPGQSYVSLGWQTFDAQGAKMHANNAVLFAEGVHMSNVKEFSTEGYIGYGYSKHIHPDDQDVYTGNRFPWWTPNEYIYSTPPIPPDTNGNGIADEGNYVNTPDGHNNGDRYQLLTYDAGQNKYRVWMDASHQNDLANGQKPIYPWPYDGTGWESDPLWDSTSSATDATAGIAKYKLYKQKDYNCGRTAPACADGTVNNANYYSALTYFNGYYIPNDLVNSAYDGDRYSGRTDQMSLRLTNSDNPQAANAWDAFVAAYPRQIISPTEITGLDDVIKAGPSRGGQYIAPPKLVISELTEQAETLGKGIVIKPGAEDIEIIINGGQANGGLTKTLDDDTNDATVNCTIESVPKPVFTYKRFINGESGKENKIVLLNVKNLNDCQEDGGWLPDGGLIYSNYGTGMGFVEAEQLPENGLTSIINGNLYLQGHYNYNASGDPNWEWQPSASIMSNRSYVLSSTFDYPQTLPYTYRHAEYPFGGTYTCPADNNGCETAGASYSINPGTGSITRDFTPGFNWYATYHDKMEHKVTGGVSDGSGINYYYYDISLVGRNGYQPRWLEMWNYPSAPGDFDTPPSGGVSTRAVVIGASVQLNDEFPVTTVPLDNVTYRACSSPPTGGYPAGYPCRTSVGGSWDLIASNSNATRWYQTRYLSSPVRPPGPGIGYAKAILVELQNTNTNWTQHNPRVTVPST